VEQTTKGLRRLEKLQRAGKLPFSVVSMADCWAKSKYGSPMFGYAVARETIRLLDDLHRIGGRLESDHRLQTGGVPKPRRAVLFGYGHITAQVARYLRKAGYTDISVYDRRATKRDEARAAGFRVEEIKERALKRADLLVSCTGETTVREGDLRYLPDGAILVNGGSPGEFDVRTKPGVAYQDPVHFEGNNGYVRFHGRMIPTDGADRHQVFRTSNFKEILVARAGSVVNFPLHIGHPRSGRLIPARYVQLEIGLLYLGMLQAARGGTPGVHRLEDSGQQRLVSSVQRQLARTGETLLDPRW
jgi:S-adenosylhomocysteine hydrolase